MYCLFIIGTLQWNDGNRYEGQWLKGRRHGKGTYIWPDGHKYEGDYVDEKRQGFGKYTWKNGDVSLRRCERGGDIEPNLLNCRTGI